MNIQYLTNVETLEELKTAYHKLAVKFHPDLGGDNEIMKIINNEFDYLSENLKTIHRNADGKIYEKDFEETPKEWRELVINLLKLQMQDVDIEIVGAWLWVTGETKPYSKQLGKYGLKLRFHSVKKAWYKSPDGYRKKTNKNYSMNDLRDMYGSKSVNQKSKEEKQKRLVSC